MRFCCRLLCLIMASLMFLSPLDAVAKKKRTSADVRRQRQKTEQALAKTSGELTAAETELSRKVAAMTQLQVKIDAASARVRHLQARIDSIETETRAVVDSIGSKEKELATLRGLYVQAVRAARRNRRQMNSMTFLFSATNFKQAYRRMRYVEEYSAWRGRKTDEIHDVMKSLEEQKGRLQVMQSQSAALKSSAEHERRSLKQAHDSVSAMAVSLKGETRRLNTLLKKQESTLRSLDDEITRLIAAEEAERRRKEEAERRRREAEKTARQKSEQKQASAGGKKTSAKPVAESRPTAPISSQPGGGFASQKGRLPSPLSHTHVVSRKFGVQRHPVLSKVEINNPGVDLETASGATARAVYPGEVSAVFKQGGYDHVVLVRHGDYLTVYANIKALSVKKGDKVKAGTVIGTLGASDVNPSRGMLHFEIRKEKAKFDPLQWLRD